MLETQHSICWKYDSVQCALCFVAHFTQYRHDCFPVHFSRAGCHCIYLFVIVYRCIDGYSRRIMCSYTNYSPGLIAGYFMDCVRLSNGLPACVRTDCGTENTLVAAIQVWATGNSGAHVYGTSPANQRIESWWSFFRRCHSQGWIDIFELMVDAGEFQPGNLKQIDCLRFCFMWLIQQDLNKIILEWNTHRIRPTAGASGPAGIPDQMYFLPPANARNCLVPMRGPLTPEIAQQLQDSWPCEDEVLMQYFLYLCQFHDWTALQSAAAARHLSMVNKNVGVRRNM